MHNVYNYKWLVIERVREHRSVQFSDSVILCYTNCHVEVFVVGKTHQLEETCTLLYCHVEEFVVGKTRQLEETCTLLYCLHVCLSQIQCFFYCTSPTPTVRCSGAEENS